MDGPGDPFLAVQAEAEAAWARACDAEARADSEAHIEGLRALEWELGDLAEAARVAEADPARFGISAAEAGRRVRSVAAMRKNVESSLERAEKGPPLGKDVLLPVGGGTADAQAHRRANDTFIQDEMQQQEVMMQRQDEDLDDLASAVERIGLMGHEMHQELAEQGEMLDDLEDDFENTRSRIGAIQNKLDRFIGETSRGQFCTIVGLFFAFILLTFLVVTT